MDVVNLGDGRYEHCNSLQPNSILDSDDSSSESGSYESSDTLSNAHSKTNDDDLKEELQKSVLSFYKSETNINSVASSENDDEFQASALCQFMDILNDLDEVLDKSLLACLDEGAKVFDTDEADVICKANIENETLLLGEGTSTQNDIQSTHSNNQTTSPIDIPKNTERHNFHLVRSKSLSDLNSTQLVVSPVVRSQNDDIRGSMRRLNPIVLPPITTQESLTLPVILFLEHHVNMRPTSAPIQLQVTAANLSGDVNGPLIVGRRALLMNRTLSLPSPVESEETTEWRGRSTGRSITRSMSTSSASSESLNAVLPQAVQTLTSGREPRNEELEEPPFGMWPHDLSPMLACIGCTVGLFNISRFAIFSVYFGANFILQFLILSFLIGIPLFTLYMCLGKVLNCGPIDMWKISPVFQGVGVAMLFTQVVIGIYSVVSLSWVFIYLRDSFINSGDKYRWALPHDFNFEDPHIRYNGTIKIEETIPQYFHSEVLQRNLSSNNTHYGNIKFQVAFNLAVVWMIVFVALSKGLRSYGKTVFILLILPVCGVLVLCVKLLTLIPYDRMDNIFSVTDWSEFFINSNSWVAAMQETFLTWGLLGSCVMQLSSHKTFGNKSSSALLKENSCIVAFTISILILSSFLGSTFVLTLRSYGFNYAPGSFENAKLSQFLWPLTSPQPSPTPARFTPQYGGLVGNTVWRAGTAAHSLSGWLPLQLVTEIIPAVLAVQPDDSVSPAWAVIFYFTITLFGVGQQLAIWHSVIAGIIGINKEALKIWETSITFLSCVFGLVMGLFITTEAGIRIIHFLDYVVCGCWWQCLIHVMLICGMFLIRGRPYCAEAIIVVLFNARTRFEKIVSAALSFTWNLILPVVLCAICVIDFRNGQQKVLYNWKKPSGYWPIWTRQVAVIIQQVMLLTVPVAAFIQTWRYMSKGPPDILDRIQNLYRPPMGSESESPRPRTSPADTTSPPPPTAPRPDPPPKYTPPPSYSTATGARLLNTIRRSFRTLRRMRTIRNEASGSNDTSQLPITLSERIDNQRVEVQPPQYTTINTPSVIITDETDSRNIARPLSSTSLAREYLRRSFIRKSDTVKGIRSSLRRSFKYGLTTSNEHLVRNIEPISNTVAMSAMLESQSTNNEETETQ